MNNDICISRAQNEANCRTTRIQCDVYAAQNPEVLMVSEGNFFSSSQPLLKCRVMCLLIQEWNCVIGLVKKQIPSFLLSYNRPKRGFFPPKLPRHFRKKLKDVRNEEITPRHAVYNM